jgi:hypothetical protein
MDWFQDILLILLLIVLAYCIYSWFIPDQRRVKDTSPVREGAPVRTEDQEEKPEATVNPVPPPAKGKVLPAERSGLTAMPAEGAQVAYPVDFNYEPKRGEGRFLHDPESGARIWVSGGPGREVEFYSYQNPEAKEAERRRKAEQREEARRREEKMGPLRGRPDVRGIRLGMHVEEVWEVLKGEVAEWEGPRETPGEDRRYFRPGLKIRLQDGATIKAEFTSRVSGSQLFLIAYEQYYREGVPYKEVIHKLAQKYGKPDDLRKLPSGDQWATYGLVSAIKPPDKAFGPGGAFFKTHVTPRYNTDFAEKLDIVFNDATLGYHDEAAIQKDRRDEARRKFEESKSDKVKF